MVQAIYFNRWIHRHPKLVRVLLVLILFAAVAQYASFALIQSHVISFYGAQPEDISFGLQIAYAGIITTLPIQFRLVKYFNTRSYLLAAFLTGIALNIGCMFTHDLVLFALMRFFIGAITCIIGGCLLMALFSTLPEAKRILVGLSLFFSLILTCSVIVGLGTSWFVLRTNWTAVYYGLVALQVVAIMLCFLVFKSTLTERPYPLYQIDWLGSVLFSSGAAATAFVMIYGPKRYWFDDRCIFYATTFAAAMILFFLIRQDLLKRPSVNLNVFRVVKFLFGLFLMLLFWGIKDSINLVYGYSASVLGWSSQDIVHSGFFNIIGVIAATFIAVRSILAGKQNLPKLLLTGFALMSCYHLWIYFNLTPHLSFANLCTPIFLHGFACGLLFVPITVFCIAMLPPGLALSGIITCAYARFIASLNAMAGFYTLQLNYNQLYKESFLSKLIPASDVLSQRQELYKNLLLSKGYSSAETSKISNMLIAKSAALQSQLLTMKAIFLLAALITGVVCLMLICFGVILKATRTPLRVEGNERS